VLCVYKNADKDPNQNAAALRISLDYVVSVTQLFIRHGATTQIPALDLAVERSSHYASSRIGSRVPAILQAHREVGLRRA